jgi:hypothetical protein
MRQTSCKRSPTTRRRDLASGRGTQTRWRSRATASVLQSMPMAGLSKSRCRPVLGRSEHGSEAARASLHITGRERISASGLRVRGADRRAPRVPSLVSPRVWAVTDCGRRGCEAGLWRWGGRRPSWSSLCPRGRTLHPALCTLESPVHVPLLSRCPGPAAGERRARWREEWRVTSACGGVVSANCSPGVAPAARPPASLLSKTSRRRVTARHRPASGPRSGQRRGTEVSRHTVKRPSRRGRVKTNSI